MYHKFTRSKGTYQIPVRQDFDEDISTYFNGDIIFSEYDIIDTENGKYIIGLNDGKLYTAYDERSGKPYFEKSDAAKTSVVNLTKVGLDVFDKPNGNILYRANIDDTLMISLDGFRRDQKSNIWVEVGYREDNNWKSGYVIYKTNRNNFANLIIDGFRFTTVLTDGVLDRNKIEELRNTNPHPEVMMFAARRSSESKSKKSKSKKTTTTSTVKNTDDSTLSSSEISNYKSSASFKVVEEPSEETIAKNKVKAAGRVDLYNSAKSIEPKIKIRHPDIIQNARNFPEATHVNNSKKSPAYRYDYWIEPLTKEDVANIYKSEDRNVRTLRDNFNYNITYYNRFKKALPDDVLTKGFMHIFFTRPDLNILSSSGDELNSVVAKDAFFKYKWMQKKDLVKQLVKDSGATSDFLMLLSNKASSFSLNDESIKYADYGKNYQNYSIMLGKGIFDSLVAGTFDIKYTDTRDLDILALHKMWIQYISNVYHGVWDPKVTYIWKKIIDYACSVNIIVTAEDGETVLYWSKYYGVFPINVPYSSLSWDAGTVLSKPDFSITYAYSWREEWNPAELTEINMNTFKSGAVKQAQYIPIFNNNYGRAGTTWVDAPFIEMIKDVDTNGKNYGSGIIFKLRFRPGPNLY